MEASAYFDRARTALFDRQIRPSSMKRVKSSHARGDIAWHMVEERLYGARVTRSRGHIGSLAICLVGLAELIRHIVDGSQRAIAGNKQSRMIRIASAATNGTTPLKIVPSEI